MMATLIFFWLIKLILMRSSSASFLPVVQGLKENLLVYRDGWRITPWSYGTVNGILAKAPCEGAQGESFSSQG